MVNVSHHSLELVTLVLLLLLGELQAGAGESARPNFRGTVAERARRDGQLRKALELLQD